MTRFGFFTFPFCKAFLLFLTIKIERIKKGKNVENMKYCIEFFKEGEEYRLTTYNSSCTRLNNYK